MPSCFFHLPFHGFADSDASSFVFRYSQLLSYLLRFFPLRGSSILGMVLIRECDEKGRVIPTIDPVEKNRLRKECLKHATGPDGMIDWDVYYDGLFGEDLFSDLSSESSANSGSDSDCVLLSATSGTNRKEDECHI